VVHYLLLWPRSTKRSNSERPARGRDHRTEHVMRTNLKKSVTFSRSAAVAAAAVPALLFFGAGTSRANQFDHNPAVWFDPWPGRLIVGIKSWSCDGNCLYTGDWAKDADSHRRATQHVEGW
jgi:hypothetical protein